MASPDVASWLPDVRLFSVETHDFFNPVASAVVQVINA